MKTVIIVQPTRFEIDEELGCGSDIYSYVGYIIYYGPSVLSSLGCVILARESPRGDGSSNLTTYDTYDRPALTLRTFVRHRKEMNEFLASSRDITYSKYSRLMLIACLDTLFNVPVLITSIIVDILLGKEGALNYPYISWKNVHDGAGGNLPGLSLSSILQVPASEWSASAWSVFEVKWDEWIYVLHALMFFGVFGTTPEMRQFYRSAFSFIPERLGYIRPRASEVESVSDVVFNSNPGQQAENHPTANRRVASTFVDLNND